MYPVRFAYVGCGFVAQTIHIPNFRALPDCSFVALAELREDLGRSVASRFGIPKVYRSHEDIAADPEIEAVGVSAAYSLQGSIAEDLIRAGKHVFMEKPMAISAARAESIVSAVQSTGKSLMVGYMKRYDPGNILIKRRIDAWRESGEAGRLLYARNHGFCGNWVYGKDPNIVFETSAEPVPAAPDEFPDWLPERWRKPYIGYLQQYTHNANLLRFLLGKPEEAAKVRNVDLDDDGITGVVTLDIGGVRATIESGQTAFHGWDEHTQVYFERGWLKTNAPALMQKEIPASVEVYLAQTDREPPRLTAEYAPPAWSYREEAKHFLAQIRSGQPFHSSAADTLQDMHLFEEIYRAFVAGRGN